MKAKWKPLSQTKTKEKILDITSFKTTTNITDEMGSRKGRSPFKTFTSWPDKPERIFVLSNDHLGLAYRDTAETDKIKIFDCDIAFYGGNFYNGGEYDIVEIWSNSHNMLTTIFPATIDDCLAIYSDSTYSMSPGHWAHSYLAYHNGRIFAAKRNTNYVNGYQEGDYVWQNMRQLTFYVGGDKAQCTGLTSFKGNLIYFSNHSFYAITILTTKTKGKDSNNQDYEIIEDVVTQDKVASDIGCISNYTIQNVSGNLIWLDNNGVYSWDGKNNPKMISAPINDDLDNLKQNTLWTKPQAYAIGGKYYLTILTTDSQGKTFVYNTDTKQWTTLEYETPLISLTVYDGKLLGLATDAKIYALEQDNTDEVIPWSLELEIDETASILDVYAQKSPNATIKAALIVDGVQIQELTNVNDNFTIPINLIPPKSDSIIKLYGEGEILFKKIILKQTT